MSKYDYLKPQIHSLMTKFNEATQTLLKEKPELAPNEIFAVLYEATAATAGQLLGSAFTQNPALIQADLYNQMMNSIRIHAENYHKHFLQTKENQDATK